MFTSRREFLGILAACGAPLPAHAAPLARKDSFFGLHFDLHPSKTDNALGRDLTEAMVDRLLERVRPDFVQYDSKGHVGYLGFPSKTGYSAPGIVRDSLEIWRKSTARHNVALYNHFSGVWDSLAVERHPDWARVRPDGKPEPNQTSTFGPYVDQLMIPELEEVAAKYSLDGAWVDGECWAVNPDYSDAVKKAFGGDLPKSAKDPRWNEFLEFNREQFRRYVRHYVDTLHRTRPGFQIASNWLYSTFVPERPDLPVDYLSGDYLGTNSISTAHLEARYLAATGKPWDLMAWGFYNPKSSDGFLQKPAVQLEQEASVVLGQGRRIPDLLRADARRPSRRSHHRHGGACGELLSRPAGAGAQKRDRAAGGRAVLEALALPDVEQAVRIVGHVVGSGPRSCGRTAGVALLGGRDPRLEAR